MRVVLPALCLSSSAPLPLWVKGVYTAFFCVLVFCYWRDFGPTNFLYFCDLALIFTLGALWLESPILASAPAVGILLPQALWMVDFLGGLVGFHITGMTAYMFNPSIPLFTRALSLFHFWLPLLLLWLVFRLGYDGRGALVWASVALPVLTVCYFFMPAPPAPSNNPNLPVNINYVYGPNDSAPQTWLPPHLYFFAVLAAVPLCVLLPTHLLLSHLCR